MKSKQKKNKKNKTKKYEKIKPDYETRDSAHLRDVIDIYLAKSSFIPRTHVSHDAGRVNKNNQCLIQTEMA